ncbi:MAG TPA: hypothetical protein VF771_02435, partial [Longimicrobiaceae bacterium]
MIPRRSSPPRRRWWLLAAAALALLSATHPRRASAQCPFNEPECGDVITITISPPSGSSWSSTTEPTRDVPVTIQFCDTQYSLAPGGETILLDGVSQRSRFTDGPLAGACFTATGTVTLTSGGHSFRTSITTNGVTATALAGWTYSYDPPPPGLSVSPSGQNATRPAGQPLAERFTIRNPGGSPGTYALSATCQAGASACAPSASSV